MRLLFFQFGLCLLFSFKGISQSMNHKELGDLHNTIGLYISGNDKLEEKYVYRGSEFIVVLLSLDTMGKVSGINLFVDENNKDSLYNYFYRMPVSLFKDWRCEKCCSKTLVLSILCLSGGKQPPYIRPLHLGSWNKRVTIINETETYITLSLFSYHSPTQDF